MSSDRRDFFKKVAGGAAALAGLEAVRGATGTTKTADAAVQADARTFVAGHFALELAGAPAGFLQSVEGGDATADVVVEKGEEGCFAGKHIANVRYEQIALECGLGMSAAFYEWLQSTLQCRFSRKDGAIIAADFNFKELTRLSFTEGLITEFGMPALDAASKDVARMTVSISPERTQRMKGSGNTVTPCGPTKAQKKWLASNFRLTIDGLDCTKVNKVDAFTIKQGVTPDNVGVEVPNLVITLAESSGQSFYDWHEDFVIKGNNGPESERKGMLEYLSPNLADALFTINFQHLGIFKLAPDKVEAGNEQVRRLKCEMYCEDVVFTVGPGVAPC
jgi:phage tail-like protein